MAARFDERDDRVLILRWIAATLAMFALWDLLRVGDDGLADLGGDE